MASAGVLALAVALLLGAGMPAARAQQTQPPPNPGAAAGATPQGAEAPADEEAQTEAQDEPHRSPFDARGPERDEDAAGQAGGLTFALTLGAARDTGVRYGSPVGETGSPVEDTPDLDGTGGDRVEDSIYVIGPSLLFHRRPSRRSEVLLAYQGELEQFDRDGDEGNLDATHHAAGLRIEHLTSRRSRLVFGGSLLDGEDPSRHLGGQLLVLPRTPFSQSRLYAGLEHVWSSTGLLFYVGHTATEIEPALGLLATGIDESEYAATLTVDRTLGQRTGLIGSYSYVVPTWSDAPEGVLGDDPVTEGLPLALSDPFHTAVIGITHRPADRIALHLAGGVHYGDEATLLASAGIARDGAAFSFGLRYEYSLLTLGTFSSAAIGSPAPPIGPNAALRDAVSQSVTASFGVRPLDRVRFEQYLWGARTSLDSLDSREPLESVSVTSRLVVEMVRRLGIFGQYDWFEQTGGLLPVDDISRSRVSVGLVIGVAGPPATWGVRQDPVQLGRVLPSTRKD